MAVAERLRLTADTFFAWEAEQLERHEFYYGEVFSMAGGRSGHARLAARVIRQLGAQLDGTPCEPFTSDLAVELDAAGHFCYPDVTVVCGDVVESPHGPAATNPTLVVEVLSPSTAAWDLGGKAAAYRRLPSVQDIVFIATDRPVAWALRRDEERWVIVDTDPDGRLSCESVGATLDVPALFADLDLGPPTLRDAP